MNKKTLAIILALLGIGVMIYWAANGHSLWTQSKVPVTVKDELFGTEHTEWRDEYRPGLEVMGPIAGVLLVGAAWLGWSAARSKRRPSLSA